MMVPVEGSEWTVEVDVVLIAAGFLGSQKYVTDAFKVDLTPRTNVATEAEKYQTSVKNVFTAGDMQEKERKKTGQIILPQVPASHWRYTIRL